MDERYAKEEDYIRGLNRMLDDANRQIDAAIRGYQLGNMTGGERFGEISGRAPPSL